MDKKNIMPTIKGWIIGVILGLVFFGSVGFILATSWSEPTAVPPLNNTEPPVNVSNVPQAKAGDLTVGGTNAPVKALDVAGEVRIQGKYSISRASSRQGGAEGAALGDRYVIKYPDGAIYFLANSNIGSSGWACNSNGSVCASRAEGEVHFATKAASGFGCVLLNYDNDAPKALKVGASIYGSRGNSCHTTFGDACFKIKETNGVLPLYSGTDQFYLVCF